MQNYKIYLDTTERYERKVQLLDETGTVIDSIEGDIDVASEIQNILQRNHIGLAEVSEFKANPGPGSFTGIKTGITIANILSWALNGKKITELQNPEYGKEPNITPPKR